MRSARLWIVFAVCAATVFGALAWVSHTVLDLESRRADAESEARREERVRLALWRMDSMLAPLVAQEAANPWYVYQDLHRAPRALEKTGDGLQPARPLVPSPLLGAESGHVRLHFQYMNGSGLTSPEAPPDMLADTIIANGWTSAERIVRAEDLLEQFRAGLPDGLPAAMLPGEAGQTMQQEADYAAQVDEVKARKIAAADTDQTYQETQVLTNRVEWAHRGWIYDKARNMKSQGISLSEAPEDVREELIHPAWLGEHLTLVRRVEVDGRPMIQGAWLDWRGLRTELLTAVEDLLPAADLRPVRTDDTTDGGGRTAGPDGVAPGDADAARMLASLPVRLDPGPVPVDVPPTRTPVRTTLVLAWVGALAAAGATAWLLRGQVALSERRGDFVSAVTHELRTPLTTFRLYTDLLAGDMVDDPERRRDHLETLRTEADRLEHLVDNVLAYSRLERGGAGDRLESLPVEDLLERCRERLDARAARDGLRLQVRTGGADSMVRTDPAAVEQILLNLVDNACKYAGDGPGDPPIEVDARPAGRGVEIRVRDHGPGLPDDLRRRLFRPFSRAARDSADRAPGVGLGLALCRRLARRMGGDLRLDPAVSDGTAFVLVLPAA